ncbi:MAG: hypothetical protein K2G30_10400 [Muribaculaceae bacterium]|nr:hypothetical protein [Muribaculaceae bacterium]MDE7142074.1 hypothetical protein [Muribaculaceae bacterium]
MNIRRITIGAMLSVAAAGAFAALSSCGAKSEGASAAPEKADTVAAGNGRKVGGPQLGTPGGGPVIDKTGDEVLQAMIKSVVPRFRQLEYADAETGRTLKYNLFTPDGATSARKLPLVLFMADASTPGEDYTRPLTQGYGALVWAAAEWQKEHPCYVLVPQFSGVAVNDAYEHTPEVESVIRLLGELVKDDAIDSDRLYTTGQSMGGMISMYYNITYPDLFAASLFVDCHWDTSLFDELARHKFTYVTAGKSGKSFADIEALEQAADKDGVKYAYAQWSAKLPAEQQDSLATALLSQGAPVNIINFTPKSVLPDDGKGSEHMYSFDYAYKLLPVREWLFRQHK